MNNIKRIYSKYISQVHFDNLIIITIGIFLALYLRYRLRVYVSGDTAEFISVWYKTIKEQGLVALKTGFSNYPPLNLYFFYIVSLLFPDVCNNTATKLPSITSDFICAYFVYRIVRLRYKEGMLPLLSFFAILFAPTIVLNGAAWGQLDSIFTAAMVASIFFLAKGQKTFACIAYGLAFASKLQAIFLAPLFFVLFLKLKVSWKHLLIIPLVYFVIIIPAWIIGRPIGELLTIYYGQTNLGKGLAVNAPTMFAWFAWSIDLYNLLVPTGVVYTTAILFLYSIVVYKSRVAITPQLIIQLALVSVTIFPYFLPKMHERYFFPADVISIIYGFYFPRYYYVPITITLISFFVYQPYLFDKQSIPLSILAIVFLLVIVIITRHLIKTLYSDKKLVDNT